MTEMPDRFEVQRLGEVRRKGMWDTVTGGLPHAEALEQRKSIAATFPPGGRFRVVPFGTGPNSFEPGDDAPTVQRAAWRRVASVVDQNQGNPDDIVQQAGAYRWWSEGGVLVEGIFGCAEPADAGEAKADLATLAGNLAQAVRALLGKDGWQSAADFQRVEAALVPLEEALKGDAG